MKQDIAMRSRLWLLATPLVLALSGCGDGGPAFITALQAAPVRASLTPGQLSEISVPGGFVSQPLARSSFRDAIDVQIRMKQGNTDVVHVTDPSDMIVAKLTIEAGGSVGWHTHPGPAIVAVQAGTISIVDADECEVREYPAGSAFVDEGFGHVHVGFNAGTEAVVVYVTYLGIPAGQAPLIPTATPDC
jgi:quercetin dioxygenase-like cupin family protein